MVKNYSISTTVMGNSARNITCECMTEFKLNKNHSTATTVTKKIVQKNDLRVHESIQTGEKRHSTASLSPL